MICAWAHGKAILLGEHAVVYGRPAIAVPVMARKAVVEVEQGPQGEGILIVAEDLQQRYFMGASDVDEHGQFLSAAVRGALEALVPEGPWPSLVIRVRSSVPIARGMGSGAAVSAAIARALAAYFGKEWEPETLSRLVFATEMLLHGTPSGIDNNVVAYERPIWFTKTQGARPLAVKAPFDLVIGDTGIRSRTRDAVTKVRRQWEEAPDRIERLFDAIGEVAQEGARAIMEGELARLGALMNHNQALLEALGVSSRALERLIEAARTAGAWGAKLSGSGMGGCMIALVPPEQASAIEEALRTAGAVDTILTQVQATAGDVNDSGGYHAG